MGVSPVHQLNPYNGLANSRFHTLLFGTNRLRSDGLPYFGAKQSCSAVIVQLLCNQECDGFSDRLWNHDKSYDAYVAGGLLNLSCPVRTIGAVFSTACSLSRCLSVQ